MTQDAPSFFTLDRGTVSTSAALVAPVDGRYRLLAAASAPTGIEPEALLEDMAWRVARTDATVAGAMDGWQGWSRLEVGTVRPAVAVLIAASERTGQSLAAAFGGAGWDIERRFFGPRPDLIALGEACLDPAVDAIVVGAREEVDEDEREHIRLLWPLAGSLARWRDDVAVIACGPLTERPEGIPHDRLFALPRPELVPATAASDLREAAGQVGVHLASAAAAVPADARLALRTSIESLAVLLDGRVEGIEIGASAGSRSLANDDGLVRHAIVADAAFLPSFIIDGDDEGDRVLRWSTLRGDPASHLDRLRELRLHPWTGLDPDGSHLRLAALRSALERLTAAWEAAHADGRADEDAADVVVLSGGAFSSVPTAAAALALVDTVRRPGAATILHDHGRVLAPLGALPVEGDRRRLLADLMDDVLLPVGSAVVTGALGGGGHGGGTMNITTELGEHVMRLEPDELRLVDLPPGIVARLEIDPEQGTILGVTGQRLTLEVSGGLGGLLVDTRDIPLELPAGTEQRRRLLESWEEPVLGTGR